MNLYYIVRFAEHAVVRSSASGYSPRVRPVQVVSRLPPIPHENY